jgi:hypothetical protein
VAQFVVLSAIGLSLFMLLDPLRTKRREAASGRVAEPLWVYQLIASAFLVVVLAVQLIPGVQLGAAAIAIAAPLVVVFAMVYLLRIVFPKRSEDIEE